MKRRSFLQCVLALFGVAAVPLIATAKAPPAVVERQAPGVFGYIHDCGRPAFYLDHQPVASAPFRIAGMFHLDGRPVQPNESMQCDSCGDDLHGIVLSGNVRPLAEWEARSANVRRIGGCRHCWRDSLSLDAIGHADGCRDGFRG